MNVKDFIKEHIKIDERTRVSRKLNLLSKKYTEFGRYLELIQKQDVGILFFNFKVTKYIHYSQVSKNIKQYNFKKWISYLQVEDFIEECSDELSREYTKDYEYNFRPKVYKLTVKGKDFLNIDDIKQYLAEEYEVEK